MKTAAVLALTMIASAAGGGNRHHHRFGTVARSIDSCANTVEVGRLGCTRRGAR